MDGQSSIVENAFAAEAEGQVEATERNVINVEDEVSAELRAVVPERFVIDSQQKASWLLRRVRAARAYKEWVKTWAEIEVRRAEREEQQLMYILGPSLKLWVTTELGRLRGKRKTINLPGGSVGYRTAPSKLVFEDEQAVLDWARANCPDAVVVSEKLSKTAIHRHVETTGELPHGASVEPEREVFFIK